MTDPNDLEQAIRIASLTLRLAKDAAPLIRAASAWLRHHARTHRALRWFRRDAR